MLKLKCFKLNSLFDRKFNQTKTVLNLFVIFKKCIWSFSEQRQDGRQLINNQIFGDCGLFSVLTVPCDPASLTVTLDCNTNSASLSWDASQGAVEYFACAQSLDGDALYCSSTVNSCTIEGLECGDIYNFSVEASNGACNSSFSPPVEMGAGKYWKLKIQLYIQKLHTFTYINYIQYQPCICILTFGIFSAWWGRQVMSSHINWT